ncbi:MAG: class II histone deacetylase [Haloarculaceae archaeon]
MPSLTAYYDETFLAHDPPAGAFILPAHDWLAVEEPHPDRPARIRNVRRALGEAFPDLLAWESVDPATRTHLERVHDPAYLDSFEAAAPGDRLTPETGVGEGTVEAAHYAAGASVAAAERALDSPADEVVYAPVRPSGHHAQPTTADGFCYLNNVAVAAAHALATGRADRVAVVDWDVHHGNGTQEAFYDRSDVLTVSLHNDFGSWGPHHPQSGGLAETGTGAGEGYTVNVPLPPGTGDDGYAHAVDEIVDPVVREYDPDLLLVSAGQDPGFLDPMGRNVVTAAGFADLGRRVRRLADDCADGALALIQEGGYQQSHLAFATVGVLEGALGVETRVGEPFFPLAENLPPVERWVAEARQAHASYWDL